MADKLTAAIPKIAKLMRVVLSPQATDGEWQNAFNLLMATLKEADPGGHAITQRIEGLDDTEMQEIFEAGREQGRAEVIEQQRTTVATMTKIFNNVGGHGTRNGRISGHDSHDGYSWSEIAESCYRNVFRFPSKHHGFLKGMADTLTGHGTITEPQANYLGNLFDQYLGRII